MKATDLMRDIALINAGWHRVEHPETGAVGIFPDTENDIAAWETKALAQSQDAERNVIFPEPRPVDDGLLESRRITRGD